MRRQTVKGDRDSFGIYSDVTAARHWQVFPSNWCAYQKRMKRELCNLFNLVRVWEAWKTQYLLRNGDDCVLFSKEIMEPYEV